MSETHAGEGLRVEEVNDPVGLAPHVAAWRELAEHAGDGGLFLTWEWIAAWLEQFRRSRPLAVLLVRDGSRLVGLLPLVEEGNGWRRRLTSAANSQSPRAGLLCAGNTEAVVRAILDHLRATRRSLRLSLPFYDVGSPLANALPGATQGFGLVTRLTRRSPLLRLVGDWNAYLGTRSKSTVRDWRYMRRRLEKSGPLKQVVVKDAAAVPSAMADVHEIERHSWKEGAGTSFTADPALERFYLDVACRFAERGWLRLHLLYSNGAPLAHVFGARYGAEAMTIKTSYDQRFGKFSPGTCVVLGFAEAASAEGATVLDFLGEEATWKEELANDVRVFADSLVFSRGLPDCEALYLLETRLKPLVRRHAPGLFDLKRRHWDERRSPLPSRTDDSST